MAWSRQVKSHCLGQYWHRSMSLYETCFTCSLALGRSHQVIRLLKLRVAIMPTLWSLVALTIVVMTTTDTTCDLVTKKLDVFLARKSCWCQQCCHWRHRRLSLSKQSMPPLNIPAFSDQSGRSVKVVALFSATNFRSYVIELLQLHDTIQIKWNYENSHEKSLHDMKNVQNFIFGTKFSSNLFSHGKHSLGKVMNDMWYQACDLMRLIQQTHIHILHQTYEHCLSHAAG